MQSSNIPTKIPLPFANAAGGSYVNTIPVNSQIGIVNGRASLADGFPPLTFTPIASGGVPPFGADMNGILKEITAIQQWQEAGGFFPYDSSFSTTIGGYPKGAILQSANTAGLWVSTVENNTSNPDTGGAGWTSLAFEGSQSVTVTSSDVTLTQLQSAYPVIIVSGTKTGNRSLIFPTIVGEWIVQNNTTGAYTLTAKTASGTGVTLTQGESTYVYGDGTNIYFADSAKVASFNGRTGTVTLNATDVINALGYTPVQQGGGSGQGSNKIYLGWATAGDGLKAQVDAIDIGYIALVSQFTNSKSQNGYQKLPNGLVIQWGMTPSVTVDTSLTVNFPIAFPNGVFAITISPYSAYITGDSGPGLQTNSWTLTQFTVTNDNQTAPGSYVAIGY